MCVSIWKWSRRLFWERYSGLFGNGLGHKGAEQIHNDNKWMDQQNPLLKIVIFKLRNITSNSYSCGKIQPLKTTMYL